MDLSGGLSRSEIEIQSRELVPPTLEEKYKRHATKKKTKRGSK